MANRSLTPLKSTAASSLGSVDKFIRLKLSTFDNSSNAWQGRFEILKKPRVLISLFLATSAFYCFVIGRNRYTSVSEFVIQQAAPLETSSASVLAGAAAAPQVKGTEISAENGCQHWRHSRSPRAAVPAMPWNKRNSL